MLKELIERLKEQEIFVEFDKDVKAMLVKEGYNPTMGARNMRRTISKLVEDPLAEEILSGNIPKNKELVVKVKDKNKIYLENKIKDKELAATN
jgi:ATP-dependent Clp protease ATP-binding subunit ClpC